MDQGVIRNLKMLYRSCLLSHSRLCVNNGKMYPVDVLSAANMLADASRAVQPTTITNYFKHVGFCASNESVRGGTVLNHCNAEDIAVGESLVADLRNGMDIPSTTTINDFARVDNDLELCTESKLTMQLCRKYSRNLLKVSRTRMTTMPTARSHRE